MRYFYAGGKMGFDLEHTSQYECARYTNLLCAWAWAYR
jgi:hypothetical protein